MKQPYPFLARHGQAGELLAERYIAMSRRRRLGCEAKRDGKGAVRRGHL
jgi:hypothetical protein